MAKSRHMLSFPAPTEENNAHVQGMCELCEASKPQTQLSTPETWKHISARQLALTQLNLTHQSCVCRSCRNDITKMIKNSNHTPRWAKIEYCCIPLCSDTAFVKGKISTPEQTAQFLEIEVEQVPYPTPLCKKHYHKVYDALQHKQTHCCACGVSLRCAPIRVCPSATMIKT